MSACSHVMLAFGLALLAGCSTDLGERTSHEPTPNPIIDNLFIIDMEGADGPRGLGGGGGSFSLEGRCLVVNTGEARYTPLFSARSVMVEADSLTIDGRAAAYGEQVIFPGSTTGVDLELEAAGECPRSTLWIRSLAPEGEGMEPPVPDEID